MHLIVFVPVYVPIYIFNLSNLSKILFFCKQFHSRHLFASELVKFLPLATSCAKFFYRSTLNRSSHRFWKNQNRHGTHIIMRHPYLRIFELANLFVADAPMKKKIKKFSVTTLSEHFEIWVWKPAIAERVKESHIIVVGRNP